MKEKIRHKEKNVGERKKLGILHFCRLGGGEDHPLGDGEKGRKKKILR